MLKSLEAILDDELHVHVRDGAAVVRHRHLARAFARYHRWQLRNRWYRRIPRNFVRELRKALAWGRRREAAPA